MGLNMKKLYRKRNIDKLTQYTSHVNAMTNEALRSKSAIAAELAFRDEKNMSLQKDVVLLEEKITELQKFLGRVHEFYDDYFKSNDLRKFELREQNKLMLAALKTAANELN